MATTNVLSPLKDEIKRQKEDRAKRKAEKKPFDFKKFLINWFWRIFHTVFLLMIVYLTITGCTVFIPSTMGYIIGSFGYTVGNNAEFLLAGLCGLFFTAWTFALSFLFIRWVWRIYINNIKATLPASAAERLNQLK